MCVCHPLNSGGTPTDVGGGFLLEAEHPEQSFQIVRLLAPLPEGRLNRPVAGVAILPLLVDIGIKVGLFDINCNYRSTNADSIEEAINSIKVNWLLTK